MTRDKSIDFDAFALMQKAVDIVSDSPHPVNKVAATLHGVDLNGNAFDIVSTNYWPAPILNAIGQDTDIGSSSGTIHAEMGCIIKAPYTKFSRVFITDPPCPNCMKYMAEAGVREIYIDHKGFYKDFAQRRGRVFEHMSLRICQKAGINVYEIWRKERKLDEILVHNKTYKPPIENPAIVEDLNSEFHDILKNNTDLNSYFDHYGALCRNNFGADSAFAFCAVQDNEGKARVLCANIHPVIGYTSDMHEHPDNKYSFMLQPINRLILNAKRKGMMILPHTIYSSRVPTSRELVNMVGAGLNQIYIGDETTCRDEWGIQGLRLLEKHGVITRL